MIIDGRAIAREILQEVKEEVAKHGRAPRVRAITVSPDAATRSYLSIKKSKALEAGMELEVVELLETASTQDCIEAVLRERADAVIVQLPLPSHIDVQAVVNSIPLNKDADVLSAEAYARFERGDVGAVIPPVAGAVEEILRRHDITVDGKEVVVIGNGKLVGKPVTALLTHKGALVTTLTRDTFAGQSNILQNIRLLISGAGVAGLITPDMITSETVLIDAGTSESNGALAGDADPACANTAKLFTPVPGGIGPIAVACLFRNVLALYTR